MQRGFEGQPIVERLRAARDRWTRPSSAARAGQQRDPDWPPVVGAVEVSTAALRWNPGRRGVLGLLVAALLAIAVATVWVLAARPQPVAEASALHPVAATSVRPGGTLRSPATGAPVAAGSATPSTALVIDVAGRVRRPGVYRLPAGARVNDALAAAGGAQTGVSLTSLNLARKLVDGEHVLVGQPTVAPAGGGGAPATASAGGPGGGPVDLNTAGVTELDALPGVGPVLAQRIVDWRTAHGRFDSVDQLRGVSGIGNAKFADLAPLVVIR